MARFHSLSEPEIFLNTVSGFYPHSSCYITDFFFNLIFFFFTLQYCIVFAILVLKSICNYVTIYENMKLKKFSSMVSLKTLNEQKRHIVFMLNFTLKFIQLSVR